MWSKCVPQRKRNIAFGEPIVASDTEVPNISFIPFPTHPFSKVIHSEVLSGHCVQLEVQAINYDMSVALFIGSRYSYSSPTTLN